MIEKARPKSVINRSPKKNDDFSHEKVLSCDFFDVFVVLPFREHTKKKQFLLLHSWVFHIMTKVSQANQHSKRFSWYFFKIGKM